MNRITFIEIGEKSFPLSFSLGLIKGINGRFGSFSNIEEAFNSIEEELSNESIEAISYLIYQMIHQGAMYLNTFGETGNVPENIAKTPDGKFMELTEEQIEVGLSINDIEKSISAITKAMDISNEQELSVADGESKNENPTLPV